MSKHVKTVSTKSEHATSVVYDFNINLGAAAGWRPALSRNGAPHSHQLKIACKPCNNGWMGRFQEEVKASLVPLMSGSWPRLPESSIASLARWATMVTMCIEFADLKTVAATKKERAYLKEHLSPPSNWQVYLALYDGVRHAGSFWHRAMLREDEVHDAHGKFNMQATTIHVGQCFFHVLSAPVSLLKDAGEFSDTLGMRQIWPIPEREPSATRIFSDAGANRVATKFFADYGVPATPHFGIRPQLGAWEPYGQVSTPSYRP